MSNTSKFFLVHYSEIALKGRNRDFFEKKLVENIRAATGMKAKRLSGRILVETDPLLFPPPSQRGRMGGGNFEETLEKLGKIFGISSYSPVLAVKTDTEAIKKAALNLLLDSQFPIVKARTFKVETRRGYKQFPKNSMEISRDVGEYVLKNYPRPSPTLPSQRKRREAPPSSSLSAEGEAKHITSSLSAEGEAGRGIYVDVKNPDIVIRIEVLKEKTYIYTEKFKGPGGLPVGTSGKMLVLISGGIDSPVASYLMMKRGCELDFIHFHSYPYTDKASMEKVEEILKILRPYCSLPSEKGCREGFNNKFINPLHPSFSEGGSREGDFSLYSAPIIDFQKEIVKKADARYRVILYRRLMYKVAEKIAQKIGAKALVSGDNLGQVASQTIENMAVIGDGIKLPIMRPLVGFDKEEIITLAKKIGTYNISIEQQGDCCSVFLPKNPATKSRLSDIIIQEKRLGMDEWIEKIFKALLKARSV